MGGATVSTFSVKPLVTMARSNLSQILEGFGLFIYSDFEVRNRC